MSHLWRVFLIVLLIPSFSLAAQEAHDHNAPEKLGKVSFPITCMPAVQQQFDRGVALLHSFAYTAAENVFQGVAEQDPRCAMAHWGIAMTHFHQLWDPPILPATIPIAQKEIQRAQEIGTGSERERQFINALALIYQDAATVPYRTRALNYEHAMSSLAAKNLKDIEAQVFYALALLANEFPTDQTHAKQKQAADLLEPLYRAYPQHPGIPHYLIHAYDNAELAPRGLPAARARRMRRMLSTCRRISSLDSAYGKNPLLAIWRQGMRHTDKATQEKNCTRWITWCMPTCKVDRIRLRLRSSSNLRICRS